MERASEPEEVRGDILQRGFHLDLRNDKAGGRICGMMGQALSSCLGKSERVPMAVTSRYH